MTRVEPRQPTGLILSYKDFFKMKIRSNLKTKETLIKLAIGTIKYTSEGTFNTKDGTKPSQKNLWLHI